MRHCCNKSFDVLTHRWSVTSLELSLINFDLGKLLKSSTKDLMCRCAQLVEDIPKFMPLVC